MSGGLISFGDYVFSNLGRYNSNFANQQSQVTRLAGMDGGFDHYGDDQAPAPVGRVTQGFRLIAATREEMDAKRDAVRLMQNYGTAKLYYQPSDPTDTARWTWARMLLPTMSEDKSGNTDLWQPVSVTFECPEPVWWVNTYVGWTWGDGWLWGDPGHIWGGGGFVINSFAQTDVVLPNGGNAISIPHITIQPQEGQSCANPILQRLEGGTPVETFSYEGILNAGEVLDINGRSQAVTVDGQAVFDDIGYETAAFFHLPPGSNDVRILLEDSGGSAPTTAYDAGDNGLDGTYNNVTVGDGKGTYVPASSSYTNIYSAGLVTFFDGALGSMITRQKVRAPSVFADGAQRIVMGLQVDTNNFAYIAKSTVADTMFINYKSGGASKQRIVDVSGPTDAFGVAATWSFANDRVRGFFDGVQVGPDLTTLGVWVGPLASTTSTIGSQTTGPTFEWDGDIYDAILSNQEATIAQIATIDSKLAAGTLTVVDLNSIFGNGNWAWWGMNESTQAARVTFFYRDSYR